jgi:hypothetical protein
MADKSPGSDPPSAAENLQKKEDPNLRRRNVNQS